MLLSNALIIRLSLPIASLGLYVIKISLFKNFLSPRPIGPDMLGASEIRGLSFIC